MRALRPAAPDYHGATTVSLFLITLANRLTCFHKVLFCCVVAVSLLCTYSIVVHLTMADNFGKRESISQWHPATSLEHELLGDALSKACLHVDAIEEYKAATNMAPSVRRHFTLGRAYWMACRSRESSMSPGKQEEFRTEARKAFLRVVQLNQHHFEAWLGLAKVYYAEGNLELVESTAKRAIQEKPDDDYAHFLLANSLTRSSQTGAHILRQQEAELKTACKLNPTDMDYKLALGDFYAEQARHDDAIKLYRQCTSDNQIEITGKIVESMESQGQFDKAIKECKKTLAAEGCLSGNDLAEHLFKLLAKRGRINEAFSYFDKYMENCSSAMAHYDFACALVENGHKKESLQWFKNGKEQQPDILPPLATMARLQKEMGSNEATVTAKCLLADFNNHRERHYGADDSYSAGVAYSILGDGVMAEKMWEEGTRGQYAGGYYSGLCFKELGKYREARKLLLECKFERDADFELAVVEEKLGDSTRALAQLRSVLKRNPNHQAARIELSQILTSLGQTDEAKREEQAAGNIASRPLKHATIPAYKTFEQAEAAREAKQAKRSNVYELSDKKAQQAFDRREYAKAISLMNRPDTTRSWHKELYEAYNAVGDHARAKAEREVYRRLRDKEPIPS